jgi:RNA polymerase sigma-70 factor, ECF subfamily
MNHDHVTRNVTTTYPHQGLHHATDPDAGVLHGRFRRARQLRDDPEREAQVALAVMRARGGDREALRYLYVQYADNVYGYVASLLRDEHEAEDVTQQVFAKLMVVLSRYEDRGVPFSAWILRIAHNAAVDVIRQRRAVPCDEVREPNTPEHGSIDRMLSIKEALGTLPEDQREVVVLRHILGLSPREIAERLGKSEPSVHGLHHRGRGSLKAALIARGSGPAVAA